MCIIQPIGWKKIYPLFWPLSHFCDSPSYNLDMIDWYKYFWKWLQTLNCVTVFKHSTICIKSHIGYFPSRPILASDWLIPSAGQYESTWIITEGHVTRNGPIDSDYWHLTYNKLCCVCICQSGSNVSIT